MVVNVVVSHFLTHLTLLHTLQSKFSDPSFVLLVLAAQDSFEAGHNLQKVIFNATLSA